MKKLLIILLFVSFGAKGQTQITLDSLSSIIKTMQAQIAALQKLDTVVYTPGQLTILRTTPNSQTVSLDNYTTIAGAGVAAAKASADVSSLTAQLNAALVRITALEAKIKVLKATSITTTTIQ